MSGQRGMIQSSGKVSTLLSRRFWQTNLLPQLVKSFFLSYELLKRSFFPLQTPMCATRSISISLTSDHRVDPSLILIQIIVTSRTAHQFILQNLCYIMCSNTRTCYPLKLVITTWNKKHSNVWFCAKSPLLKHVKNIFTLSLKSSRPIHAATKFVYPYLTNLTNWGKTTRHFIF